MSIYYNPQLMRLLNDERIEEVIRARTGRRPQGRSARTVRPHANPLADDCLIKATAYGTGC